MKKVFIILLCGLASYAQDPIIKTDLPTVIPPSPTVAGLMKFEEVPVNNYTGIPDISIPLYSVGSHSKDIAINLSLNYHPGSTIADEEAGYVGLGWSLIGGGTISRTVKGLPDDCLLYGSKFSETRIGIHGTDASYQNKCYEVMDLIGTAITTSQQYTINKFLWETRELGMYDTEHDLYQFNFMGHSGRFYISRKTGAYDVIKLDNDNSVKIVYDAVQKVFTAYDDKGYRFVFDVKEKTSQSTMIENESFDTSTMPSISQSLQMPEFISAFQLSKIYDTNDKLLVEYSYNRDSVVISEGNSDVTTVWARGLTSQGSTIVGILNQCGGTANLQPRETTSNNLTLVKTKKIKSINVIDIAKIDFTLENGREDTNMLGSYRLKGFIVKAPDSTVVKRISLDYSYSTINSRKRLVLTKVTLSDAAGTINEPYGLEYFSSSASGYGKDYWGYYNSKPAGYSELFYDGSPTACKLDVLQKMTIPTGGAYLFNFESNTYSYIGNEEITNFDDNAFNWTYSSGSCPVFNVNGTGSLNYHQISSSQNQRYISVKPQAPVTSGGTPAKFKLYKVNGSQEIAVNNLECGNNDGNCYTDYILLEANTTYRIRLTSWFDSEIPGVGYINSYYIRTKNLTQSQFFYGGGVRIKNIGYFTDANVPMDYYNNLSGNSEFTPAKQKNFNYSFFDNANKSSGSLAFPKPVYEYSLSKKYYDPCSISNSEFTLERFYEWSFGFHTETNNLKVQKTKGSDVGYQNVTVSETNNGYSRYTYTSPIDYPEYNYTLSYPFYPSINRDSERGLIKEEKTYNQASQLLTETTYQYDIVKDSLVTGLSINSAVFGRYFQKYQNESYDFYANLQALCDAGTPPSPNTYNFMSGQPKNYIDNVKILEAFAWPKLSTKTTKEYFNGQAVETKQTFTYNNTNKRIASQSTETYNAAGLPLETQGQNYYYVSLPSVVNRISDIERVEALSDGNITNVQKIIYANTYSGNSAYLPTTIQAKKMPNDFENRVQFVKYDEYSNPLEVKLENGTSIVYIWGYCKTQPIAKIENTTYSAITASLITNAQNASNSLYPTPTSPVPNPDAEGNLLNALTALRAALPNAMVTTYIYKPLVGVKAIYDPNGDKITYEYDTFGRLKLVRDKYGNILSENEYHYRPQTQP